MDYDNHVSGLIVIGKQRAAHIFKKLPINAQRNADKRLTKRELRVLQTFPKMADSRSMDRQNHSLENGNSRREQDYRGESCIFLNENFIFRGESFIFRGESWDDYVYRYTHKHELAYPCCTN